ncbi:MAG: CheY-like chemotaxis protein [Lentimonas sp.]|jgi:CheY-like chemotaxis protein
MCIAAVVTEEPPAQAEKLELTRVLLVDDPSTNRIVASFILKKLNIEFELAVNGQEALEALEQGGFDLVLMDLQMPIMDGTSATQIIRSKSRPAINSFIPIVAMTANAMAGDREKYIAAGMDDYVSKPISLQSVQEAIDRCLSRW